MSEMNMREKAEKAARKAVFRVYGHILVNGGTEIADAVLDVLAEPDEGMIEAAYNAGLDIYWSYRSDGRQGGAEDVWTAMLQAARTPGAIEETGRRG